MDGYILQSFSVEFFILTAVLVCLIYNAYILSTSFFNFPLLEKETFNQSIFILFIATIIAFDQNCSSVTPLSLFYNDVSAMTAKPFVLLSVLGALMCGRPYFIAKKLNLFEYYILVLLAIFSLLFLISANDLITVYLCLEMQSLCFYVLASFNRYSLYSVEAGLKYFVLGAFSSCIFLFGASLIYGITGTTNLANLALLFADISEYQTDLIFISLLCILVTILFKLAAFPFHIWTPDVYDGAPLNSTILFILVPKLVLLFLIFRLFYGAFFPFFNQFQLFFLMSGIFSVLFGSILALKQKRFKKLLIFSSISHIGFIMLGFATGSVFGAVAVFYYILMYILTGMVIWGLFSLNAESNKNKNLYLTDFAFLIKNNNATSFALGTAFFSMAGIPPLIGFSMKYFIFSAALASSLYEISVLIIVLSVIGSFYYLRFIKILFFEKLKNTNLEYKKSSVDVSENDYLYILISFCLFIILFGFFNPNLFLLFCYKITLGIGLI